MVVLSPNVRPVALSNLNIGKKVGPRTVQRYANAVVSLWRDQKQQGANNNPHPRDDSVKDLMRSMARENHKRKRESFVDRGIGTLLDGGNTMADLLKISEYFVNRKSTIDLRNRLTQMLCSFMALRGESSRDMDLADFFSISLENEGHSECVALVGILDHGKTNQYNRVEFGASIRHKDVRICVQGALAMYLFARFHIDCEPFPNFADPSEWYNIKLLKSGKSRVIPMSYRTQYKAIGDAFDACGIASKSKTHAGRGSSVRMAELLGVPEFDLRQLGRWNQTAMEGCYLSRLPRKAMRALGGFHPDQSNFYLPRDVSVPETLQRRIFPDIERYEDMWKAKEAGARDLATIGHLKLLKYLRKVLLQDSIYMMEEYPDLPIWNYFVFQSEEYFAWKAVAGQEIEETETPMDLSLQQAMPHLTQLLKDQHRELVQRTENVGRNTGTLLNKLDKVLQRLCDGSARIRIDISGPNNEDGPSVPSTLLQPASDTPSNVRQGDVQTIPQVRMGRGVSTVRQLWLEWSHGLGGNPPICELEEKHGTKWRRTASESKFFRRRKKIIDAIITHSTASGGSLEESLGYFTQLQGNKTLDWLSKNID